MGVTSVRTSLLDVDPETPSQPCIDWHYFEWGFVSSISFSNTEVPLVG